MIQLLNKSLLNFFMMFYSLSTKYTYIAPFDLHYPLKQVGVLDDQREN